MDDNDSEEDKATQPKVKGVVAILGSGMLNCVKGGMYFAPPWPLRKIVKCLKQARNAFMAAQIANRRYFVVTL